MAWHTSTRAQRLPPNWATIRTQVATQAHGQCQATKHHPHCDGKGTEVDHITPGDNHHPTNLQYLSTPCHANKTNQEAADRNRARATMRTRPHEPHPGATP